MTAEAGATDAALERLVLDWQTIWCSELQALATDGEAHDAWAATVRAAAALADFRTPFDSAAAPAAGADAPARPAAAVAAPDPRDAAILRLERRVAELERMLAGLGHDGRAAGG